MLTLYIATIDGGTSNTRVFIWCDGKIISEARTSVGVRDTAIEGTKAKVIAAAHDTLQDAAKKAGINVSAISLILAAGMLTSNVGLYEIPHIAAPVSLDELAGSMVCAKLPGVAEQPIWFVPGVKNLATKDITVENMSKMDMMRGEETEASGLLTYASPKGNAVFVLPGSHNKYVMIDKSQRMLGCFTTLGGEVLHSLTFDTVLADTLRRSFADSFDEKSFLKGVEDGSTQGFLHSAFMTRILGMHYGFTPLQAQNYILGVVLADELASLKACQLLKDMGEAAFVISGRPLMQQAYACLFKREKWMTLTATEEQQRGLCGFGAISLARRRGLIK